MAEFPQHKVSYTAKQIDELLARIENLDPGTGGIPIVPGSGVLPSDIIIPPGVSSVEHQYALSDSKIRVSNVNEWNSTAGILSTRQRACTYGNGYYVVCGTAGDMAYSEDGITWSLTHKFTSDVITGIAYGRGKFIAVDAVGNVWSATETPASWEQISVSWNSIILEGICYANNRFIIIGDPNFLAFSDDGETWTQLTTAQNFKAITFGNGIYLAVGNDGAVAISHDCKTWLDYSDPAITGSYRSATFGAGKYIIGGQGGIIRYSEDGKTWVTAGTTSASSVNYIRGITYTEGRFYAVMYVSTGKGEIWISEDAATWYVQYESADRLWCCSTGDDIIITSGDNGTIYKLDLNINWSTHQPDVPRGKYLWERVVVTLSDGTKILGDGVCTSSANVNLDIFTSEIPDDYTRLAYIESQGGPWIDTEISAPNGFKFEGDIRTLSIDGDQGIIGVFNENEPYYRNYLVVAGSRKCWLYAADAYLYTAASVEADTEYHISMSTVPDDIYCLANGHNIIPEFIPGSNNRSALNLTLFGIGGDTTTWSTDNPMQMGPCRIYVNNTIVRNFVPAVRNSDAVVGMYDVISNRFFTNAGSGTFLAGTVSDSSIINIEHGGTGATNADQARINLGAASQEHVDILSEDIANKLSKDGGVITGDIEFEPNPQGGNTRLIQLVSYYKNGDKQANPKYPYTGFYQWGDLWQVNARNADKSFSHDLFSINTSTKAATFSGSINTLSSITTQSTLNLNNGKYITCKNTTGTSWNLLTVDGSNNVVFGDAAMNANTYIAIKRTMRPSTNIGSATGVDLGAISVNGSGPFRNLYLSGRIYNADGTHSVPASELANKNDIPSNADDIGALPALVYDPQGKRQDIFLYVDEKLGILPAGYSAVEYIESTGTQYINTGFYPSGGKYRILISFMYTREHYALSLFGNSIGGDFSITAYGGEPRFYVGNSVLTCGEPCSFDTIYTLDVTAHDGALTAIWNGVKYTDKYIGNLYTGSEVYLFGSNNNGSIAETDKGYRLYSIKIYDNDSLVRNFIPCVDSNDAAGLYDAVNGQFYANAGTGVFLRGGVSNLLPIKSGGTGASTPEQARTNLGAAAASAVAYVHPEDNESVVEPELEHILRGDYVIEDHNGDETFRADSDGIHTKAITIDGITLHFEVWEVTVEKEDGTFETVQKRVCVG